MLLFFRSFTTMQQENVILTSQKIKAGQQYSVKSCFFFFFGLK